jgi:hypothetical protein
MPISGDHFGDGGSGEIDRARIGRRRTAGRGNGRAGVLEVVVEEVVVACGVLATVESPEPQPVNSRSDRYGSRKARQ